MPFYQSNGKMPKKRHTVFKKNNKKIYYEELVSREGFSNIYSNLYHIHMPTRIMRVGDFFDCKYEEKSDNIHQAYHFRTNQINRVGDAVSSRELILFNEDISIYKSHIDLEMNYYYRNGHFDELYYIQKGSGDIFTNFGLLNYTQGDYIIIPRGVIYKLIPSNNTHALLIESKGLIETPSKYRNGSGQLLEHSPFCERDIKVPILQKPINKEGEFLVKVRLYNGTQDYFYANDPLDIIGWDGYYFPWILNINNFEPITGSIHQPPPVHQTFQSRGFVICSFVPRLFDYHPNAIPSPYPHSNVDSDEVIFYSKGNFMSRKGIDAESITHHPMGLPHGPQPGKYEESVGKKKTDELAVMIDTFKPLKVANLSTTIIDKDYPLSWK